jgi:hypothetical protein
MDMLITVASAAFPIEQRIVEVQWLFALMRVGRCNHYNGCISSHHLLLNYHFEPVGLVHILIVVKIAYP